MPRGGAEVAVAEVARTAQLLCGAAPVEEALLSVRLQPGEATGAARQLLEGLGLRTALDLRLLGGGQEAQETMDALKTAGISVGDRSKIRMLVGDRAHLGRLFGGAGAQAGGEVPADATAGTCRTPGSDSLVEASQQPRLLRLVVCLYC